MTLSRRNRRSRPQSRPGNGSPLLRVPLVLQAALLYGMGRLPICNCGYVKFWHGVVQSSENSQHIADWYSVLTYPARHSVLRRTIVLFPRLAWPARLIIAMLVEGTGNWSRIRAGSSSATVPRRSRSDYYGDSIVNSVSDTLSMVLGFLLARNCRLPRQSHWESLSSSRCSCIRDNLTLNILMLIYPFEAIKQWQAPADPLACTGRLLDCRYALQSESRCR